MRGACAWCYAAHAMPELPEVESARRNLVQWLDGRRVVRAEADASRVCRGARPEDF
ncbi:MAG TPA: DNA-formamidopyrimidine glycosylase family protein, partial [Archangium sp.]|nr:DNA-formamidopyrimidine glycosylase family protein [Archangium sp.]